MICHVMIYIKGSDGTQCNAMQCNAMQCTNETVAQQPHRASKENRNRVEWRTTRTGKKLTDRWIDWCVYSSILSIIDIHLPVFRPAENTWSFIFWKKLVSETNGTTRVACGAAVHWRSAQKTVWKKNIYFVAKKRRKKVEKQNKPPSWMTHDRRE